ncbi:peroxisomal coenzyme A diphosphatase NUDT7 isoform 2-T2 [Anomaloglossus baeobatrachus]|uniref:peroxisomal coenzyme A diphosphatase NUDT7 isoform X2 n=1 Tax=Anomaloglossus baeobatrachus TaxID=238106 RepID=UPI003F4FE32D
MSLTAEGPGYAPVMSGSMGDMGRMSPSSSNNAEEPSADHQREKIKSLLEKYDVGSRYTHIPLPKASILLPLLIRQGKPHLLLTVRSMQLKTMPGEVCFPGGRQEHSEDDIQTALREAHEEVGLCPEQVEIIGRLTPTFARSPNSMVTPVVGIVDNTFQPTPNPDEVSDLFLVPLEFFVSTEDCTLLKINVPPFGSQTVHQYFYVDEETKKRFKIWGLTAYCALMLSIIVFEKRPSFDPGFDLESILENYDQLLQKYYTKGKL